MQLRASNVVAGNETLQALRHRQTLDARAAEEEDLMVRVPLSKEQRKKLKADRRGNLSGAAMMNDFADDVADLVGVRPLRVLAALQWVAMQGFRGVKPYRGRGNEKGGFEGVTSRILSGGGMGVRRCR